MFWWRRNSCHFMHFVITWSSDGSQERTGFKICMQSAEALRIDRMKHNRIKLQSLSRYDCPSTVWKKRKYYEKSNDADQWHDLTNTSRKIRCSDNSR